MRRVQGSARAFQAAGTALGATEIGGPGPLVILALGAVLAWTACSQDGRGELTQPSAEDHLDGAVSGAGGYDPGQVLVRVRPGTDMDHLNAYYGTWTAGSLESERLFLLSCPPGKTVDDLLPVMATNPSVETAEPNYRMQAPEAQGLSGGSIAFADNDRGLASAADQSALRRIRATQAQAYARGAGVLVAVLDTGVDAGHPLLEAHVALGGLDVVEGDDDPADEPDGRDSDGDGSIDEAHGHGTAVAGLVLSVAPEASILPIRVLDSDGIGTAFGVARGLAFAERSGAKIINMSFGMGRPSRIVSTLLDRLHERGAILVASAGNRSVEEPPQFPAGFRAVIGVAATDSLDRKADFSNFGPWVGVSAPGVGLLSSVPGAQFALWSGTSFAAALVSGEAALLRSAPSFADPKYLPRTIRETAVSLVAVDPAFGSQLGAGRIDVLTAVRTGATVSSRAREGADPGIQGVSGEPSETGSR